MLLKKDFIYYVEQSCQRNHEYQDGIGHLPISGVLGVKTLIRNTYYSIRIDEIDQ